LGGRESLPGDRASSISAKTRRLRTMRVASSPLRTGEMSPTGGNGASLFRQSAQALIRPRLAGRPAGVPAKPGLAACSQATIGTFEKSPENAALGI
jgi:hypothetical protein